MAKVIVQKVTKEGTTKKGNTFYTVAGTIDGEIDVFDVWFSPEIGKEYEGEVKETDFGKSFSLPRSGGGGGFRGGGGRSPEERAEIIRQSTLEYAITLLTARAQYVKPEEALKLLSSKTVLDTAAFFARYAGGTTTNTNAPASAPEAAKSDPVAEVKEAMPGAEEVDNSTPTGPDVDPKDLPF